MVVLKMLLRLMGRIFSCHHWRTRIHEGKCYCPDCGRGLIYQWAVLRCGQCHTRLESHMLLGQISPVRRCCLQCGDSQVVMDWLEAPAYFQLHKAQLMVREEERYLQWRFGFTVQSAADVFQQRLAGLWSSSLGCANAPMGRLSGGLSRAGQG